MILGKKEKRYSSKLTTRTQTFPLSVSLDIADSKALAIEHTVSLSHVQAHFFPSLQTH